MSAEPVLAGRVRIGFGCMRLSTAPDRDDERAIAVIHTALDAGATLLDTADVYCRDDGERGHNERLIAEALRRWPGDRSSLVIATKGGLSRPRGQWVADGRAKSLRAACEASRRALDADVIDLYQLHAVDPRTPLETSVRALAALRDAGLVRQIGLCNVTVGQIDAARRITDIDAVQVSLSPFDDENLRNGVAEHCRDLGIRLLAYRPLGGERASRLSRDAAVARVAARHGVTPHEVVLAWVMDLNAIVVPLPGATRVETARGIANALGVRLSDDERAELDERFSGRLLRVPRALRRPTTGARGEVVLVMGMPGAGKSTVARELTSRGYERLNRDARGGSLADLVTVLDEGLSAGGRAWVLDNTYPTRASRNAVIECAWRHGVPVRCVWVTTSVADAQVNAITRVVAVHGGLPTPEEMRARGKEDPRYLGPDAQFRYERALEVPTTDEGFEAVEERPFVRARMPDAIHRAVVVDLDLLTPAEDGALALEIQAALRRYRAEGWLLFAHGWRPGASPEAVSAEIQRVRTAIGVEIELGTCPHEGGPPVCWCRKPIPGLVVEFAMRYGVALDRSIAVGTAPPDRTMARRLGLVYHDAAAFFAPHA